MSPYRTAPLSERSPDVISDDVILGVVLLVVGGLRVVIALVNHETFETEATLALMMIAASLPLLLRPRR